MHVIEGCRLSKFALLFLLLFFGGICSALVYNGAVAFIIYELVYFLNPDDRWWSSDIPGFRYSFITVLLMMFVLARDFRKYGETSSWKEMPTLKWLVILLAMYLLANLFALDIVAHKRFTFEFAKLIVIIFVAYKLIDSDVSFNLCLWAYLVGCTYIGYLAASVGRDGSGRVEGIGMTDGPDANDTAAALVPAAVMLMYFAWLGGKKEKVLAVLMGAIIANGLVLINSRGAFLGGVVSLGVFLGYMIFSKYQKKGQRRVAFFLIIFGLSGAFYVTDDLFLERMATLKNTENKQASGSSRIEFWMATFDMLEDHPMGLGVNGYNKLAPQYMDDETRGGVEHRSVHSSWFQGLSELGWHGFFVFCCMIVSLLKMSYKAKKALIQNKQFDLYFKVLVMECALLGYMVAGTFINRFRAEILYWMILFVAIAVKLYYLQPKKAQQKEKMAAKTKKEIECNE